MKLLKLEIGNTPPQKQFRSLYPGFTINFHSPQDNDWNTFNPFCLVGVNGTGKSNVLEALASIFFHLECCSCKFFPTDFHFSPAQSHPGAYQLQYLIQDWNGSYNIDNYIHVKIRKEDGREPVMHIKLHREPDTAYRKIEIKAPVDSEGQRIDNAPGKNYLPDIVAAYSSGENEILSIPFRKSRLLNFDQYTDDFNNNLQFRAPQNSLIYIDEGMSQAVLLACLLYEDHESTLAFLKKELGIQDIVSFRMNINMQELNNGITVKEKKALVTDHIKDTLDELKGCATSWYHTEEPFAGKPESLQSVLVLDFLVNDQTRLAFANVFADTFECFRFFQVLYELNANFITGDIKQDVYKSRGVYTHGKMPDASPVQDVFHFLDFRIKKKMQDGTPDKELLLREFSDGEHQLLHAMGICLMLKKKNTLLLLDEPETHFNPSWRGKFVKILNDSITAGQPNGDHNVHLLKDILLTSHSPFIISDCMPHNVILFEKDENKKTTATKVSEREDKFKTYGTSVEFILDKLFNYRQSIGDLSYKVIKDTRKTGAQASPEEIREQQEKLYRLGESIEKDIALARLNRLLMK